MSKNKSQKAIEVLTAKSKELDTIINVQQGNTWKASLMATLNSYLGKDSTINERLKNLHFTKRVTSSYPGVISSTNVYDETKKENFRNLIENTISHIETHGVLKIEPKGNFLHSFNNSQIIGGLFVAASLIFSFGTFVGKIEKDREIVETNNKSQAIEEKYKSSIQNVKDLEIENGNLNREIILLKSSPK